MASILEDPNNARRNDQASVSELDDDGTKVKRLVDQVLSAGRQRQASCEQSATRSQLDRKSSLEQRRALQTVLLGETLRLARARVPFYTELYKRSGIDERHFRIIDDLARFPLFDRHLINASEVPTFDPDRRYLGFRHTSGTTTGRRFVVPFTAEEIEFSGRLVGSTPEVETSSTEKALHISINYIVRRIKSDQPKLSATTYTIDAPFYAETSSEAEKWTTYLIELINSEFELPGIASRATVLSVSPAFILPHITRASEQSGVNCRKSSIQRITCTGYPISTAEQARMSEAWNAKVTMGFSCAELNGHAVQCDDPRNYRFNLAVYPEVVDPDTFLPVKEGQDGLLITTSLYPFQIACPLIRYWPGDLAVMVSKTGTPDEPGPIFQPVGRAVNSVDLSPALSPGYLRRFLGAIDVIEILGNLNEQPSGMMHKLNLSIRVKGESKLVVTLGVERGVVGTRTEKSRLRETIRKRLLAIDAGWCEACKGGRLEFVVKLFDPGRMKKSFVLKNT